MRLVLILFNLFICLPLYSDENSENIEIKISSEESWLRVLAFPDGPLKHLGHHHVISHQNINGNVKLSKDPLNSSIDIELNVNDFVIDDPFLRMEEGGVFDGEVPQKDIDGTRVNMLSDNLLDSIQFSSIYIRSKNIDGQFPNIKIHSVVNIKGRDHDVTFPAEVQLENDNFIAKGEIDMTHALIGLTPFSALGGLLTVRDLMIIKFEIKSF
tara:strand:- start:459 stop:1094 length:636 start_codon:yes stop_codon:yes gene_type:complete